MKSLFFIVSAIIGLMMIWESRVLYAQRGNLAGNKALLVSSSIEFVWALLSLLALYQLSFSKQEIMPTALFLCHMAFGFIYSFAFVKQLDAAEDIDNLALQLPPWYVAFAFSVGIAYTLSNLYLLLS